MVSMPDFFILPHYGRLQYASSLNLLTSHLLFALSSLPQTTKGELCRGINAVCLIDDSMVHALDCAPDMAKVILVDIDGEYMWNKEQPASPSPVSSPAASPTTPDLLSNSVSTSPSTPSNIVRALSWNDVEKELASLRDSLKALKQ